MDFANHLILGFQVALSPSNVFFCFFGVVIGTLVGVLPGLGPITVMSLLLPVTFKMAPVTAIIMLAGIYYGAMYGGSTTSILVNIPGETASVVTCLDGYQMARQGRAGPALGISAFGSFIGGTASLLGLATLAPILAEWALKFGPQEYFCLMVLGLVVVTYLGSGPMWKALLTACIGLYLACIGLDPERGSYRFTFGILEFIDGIGLVPVAVGLFGLSEVLINTEQSMARSIYETKITNLFPTLKDWANCIWPIIRGTFLGFFLGILPGGGAVMSSFVVYALEKKISKTPEKFGTGMIEGVAAPETANNAATGGAFVPLLTLGIPSNVVMALLLGALIVYGVTPGPLLIKENPDLFWGVIASMYVGNIMLLVLNLPLIGVWVRILRVPYPILFPIILLFCIIGAYTLNNSIVEVILMIFFGVVGYLFKKFKYDSAPLILALVLGPLMEHHFRQSMLLAEGRLFTFFERPISAIIMILALFFLFYPLVNWFREKPKAVID